MTHNGIFHEYWLTQCPLLQIRFSHEPQKLIVVCRGKIRVTWLAGLKLQNETSFHGVQQDFFFWRPQVVCSGSWVLEEQGE
jgi:hypothetical protein